MIDKLFKDIADRLKLVETLRWIDLEYGQLEIPADTYPVQFPCALIDFPQMDFQEEGYGNQQAMIMLQVRLGVDLYEDFQVIDGIDAPDQATALSRLQIITDTHKVLHGFETDYFSPLVRTSITTERRDDGIKVFVLQYGAAAKDDSAAEVYTQFTGAGLQLGKG